MRYHYVRKAESYDKSCSIYICDHAVYNRCTLYTKGDVGLALIQQRYSKATKHTRWTELDPGLGDELYSNEHFEELFSKYAGPVSNGLYPTLTIRQAMWFMRMKPLKRQKWETTFDYKPI